MSADPQQQIDITPYKVIRENAISSNQQKVPEVRSQSTDLATSILDKLTEIKDNLYPSHLNIPPQKFGQPTGYISPLPGSVNNLNPSQAIEHPAEGIETLFRKDTYVSSIQSKSRDHSPDLKSPGSPFYFPSPGHSKIHQHGDLSADLNHDLAHAIQENINTKTAMELRSGSNSPILFTGQSTLTPPRLKSPISKPHNIITASINEDLYRANRFEPEFTYPSQGGSPGFKPENSDAFGQSLPSTMMNSKAQFGEMGKSGVGSNLQGEIASNSNYSLPQFSSTDVRTSNQSAQNNETRPEYSQQRSDLLASVNKAQATFGFTPSKSPANTLASSPNKGKALDNNNGSPHHLPNVNSVVTEEDSYIVAENRANRAANSQQYSTLPTPKNRPQAEGDDISQFQGSVPRENTGEISSTRNSQVRTSNSQRNQHEREHYEQRNQDEEYQSQPSSNTQSRRENVPESSSTRNSQIRSSNSQRDQDNFESGNQDSSKPPRFQDSQRENATVSSIRNSQVRSSNSQRDQGDYEHSNEDSSRPRYQDDQRENIGTESSTRTSQVRSNRQRNENESDEFQGPGSQNRRENAGEVSSTRNSQVRSNRQARDSYEAGNQDEEEISQPHFAGSQNRRENAGESNSTRNSQVRSNKPSEQTNPDEEEIAQPHFTGSQNRRENAGESNSTRNSQVRSSNQQRDQNERENYESGNNQDSSKPPRYQEDQRENLRESSTRNSQVRSNQQGRENSEQKTNQYEEEEISQPHFAGSQNRRENAGESTSTRNSQVRTSNQQRDQGYEQRNQDEEYQSQPSSVSQNRRENAGESTSTRNSQVRSSNQQRDQTNQDEEYQSQPSSVSQNRRENTGASEFTSTRNSQVRSSKQDSYEQARHQDDQRENIASENSTRNSQVRSSKQRDQDEADEKIQPQGSVSQNRRENTGETSSTRNSQVRSNQQGRDNYDQRNQDEEEISQPHFAVSQKNTGETSSTRNSQVRSNKQGKDSYEATYQDDQPQDSVSQNRRENTGDSTTSTRNSQVRSNKPHDQDYEQKTNQYEEEEISQPHFAVSQKKRENPSESTSTRNSQVRTSNQQREQDEVDQRSQPQGSVSQNRRENASESTSTRNSQVRTSNRQRDQDYDQTNQDEEYQSQPQNRRENVPESSSTRNSQVRSSNQQRDQTNQDVSKPPRYQQQDDQESEQGSFTQQKQRPEQQNKRHNNEDTEESITPKQRADTPSDNGRKPVEEMTLQNRRQKEAEGNIEASRKRSDNVNDKARQMEKIQELEEMMAQSRRKSQNEPGHSKRRSESHYENLKLQGLEGGAPGKRRENADTSEQGSYISKYRSETPSEYSNPGDLSQRSQHGKSEQTTPRKSKKADDPYYEENNSNYVKSRPEIASQGPTPKNSMSTDNTPKNQFEAQQKPQGKIISNRVGTNAEQGTVVPKQKAEQSLGQIVNPQGNTSPLDAQALDKRFSFGLVVSDVSERESGPDTDSDRRYYLSKQAEDQARNMGVEGLKKKSGYVRGPNTSEDQEQLSNRLEHSSKPNTQREETEEIDERQESQENQDFKDQIIQEEKQFRKDRRGHRQNQRGRDQAETDPQDQPRRGEGQNSTRSSRVQKLPESLPEESNEESVSSSSKIKADESSDPNDVKQRNFTFVSRTSGTESSQQMVNNTLSSSAHKMDTDRGLNTDRSNQPNDSVVVEKKKPTRPTTASISPPRRQGDNFAGGSSGGGGGGQMTAYITLEHEKKSKSTKTQPSSLNIDEHDSKTQPPSVKNIDDPQQQTMNRNSSQMNFSTPNNPTGKRPTLDNLSPPAPGVTLQVPPSGMGTRQTSPMHNNMHAFQNMQNMGMHQSPQGMNQMHPMMNQMGQQMGGHGHMFGMSNLSSIPNISNMHTPMNNMNFPNMPNIPMPNFNEGGHAGEYQKYILMMMNYYENHLGNLKTMCVQQNEVLNQEKQKNQSLEHRNSELVKKIQELDSSIKEQYATFENSQKELKTRYEVVLDELSNVKKGLAARQIGESNEGHPPRPAHVGDVNYQTMLYHEIISLRKDLDNQRQTMYDYRSTSRHLEDQMRDLERVYIDELKNNSSLSHKREQIQDTLDKYKTDYLKMDTLNKIILDGYERTRKDFEELKSTTHLGGHVDNNEHESINREQIDSALNSRERSRQPSVGYNVNNEDKKREILLRSISPLRYEAEDNKEEMLRNKMRAQESQVKDLLNWNANSSKTPVVYTQTYPAPNNFDRHHHHNPQQMGHQRGNPILQNSNPITGGGERSQNNQMYTSSSQAYGGGNYNSNNPRQQQQQTQMQMQQQQQQYNSNPRGQQQRAQPQPPVGMMNMNDQRGGRGNVTFPSYQKIEDNKDEIQRTDYELSRLTQHRKIIENELFKMPSTAKSLDQKRKKAALEMELEGIDYQIEDCKNKLRKYDVLTAKV